MRLSRTAWLSLAVGIFVIGFATLFTINSGQVKEQKQLNDSLAKAQAQLPKLVSNREALESQLAEQQDAVAKVESLLTTAQAKFPTKVESIENDEVLFSIADDCNLEVKSLRAAEPSEEKVKGEVEEITYSVTSFEMTLQAAGSPPVTVEAFETYIDDTIDNVLNFVKEVATGGHFTSATIESVDMQNLEPPAEPTGSEPKPSAIIKLDIYGYKGE